MGHFESIRKPIGIGILKNRIRSSIVGIDVRSAIRLGTIKYAIAISIIERGIRRRDCRITRHPIHLIKIIATVIVRIGKCGIETGKRRADDGQFILLKIAEAISIKIARAVTRARARSISIKISQIAYGIFFRSGIDELPAVIQSISICIFTGYRSHHTHRQILDICLTRSVVVVRFQHKPNSGVLKGASSIHRHPFELNPFVANIEPIEEVVSIRTPSSFGNLYPQVNIIINGIERNITYIGGSSYGKGRLLNTPVIPIVKQQGKVVSSSGVGTIWTTVKSNSNLIIERVITTRIIIHIHTGLHKPRLPLSNHR